VSLYHQKYGYLTKYIYTVAQCAANRSGRNLQYIDCATISMVNKDVYIVTHISVVFNYNI